MIEREYLKHERRHLAQTTRALTAILEIDEARALPLMGFYRAAVTYLAYNTNRLCLQDKLLSDIISARFAGQDPLLNETLEAVYRRLNKHRQLIAGLLADLAVFEGQGPEGQKQFENAVRGYLDARSKNRAKKNHSLAEWRDQVVTAEDWPNIVNRTDMEVKSEQILFDRLVTCAPQGLDLFPEHS